MVRGDELVARRTEFSASFQTDVPGVVETVVSAAPLHFDDGEGGWRRFDTELEPVAGDLVSPSATDVPTAVATDASADELVTVEPAEGVSVGFGLAGADDVAAAVDGDTASFDQVAPGVDLELTVLPRGVKEAIILGSPEAPTTFEFPLVLEGVTAAVAGSGAVEYRDGSGAVVAVTPAGFMEDSAHGAGVGAQTGGVTYTIVEGGGGPVLRVDLDEAWLADPARVFPVVVDPTTSSVDPVDVDADDTYVVDGSTLDRSAYPDLRVGDSGAGVARSYLHFSDLDTFDGMNVYDATLELTQFGANVCAAGAIEAYRVESAWDGYEVTEFPGPLAEPNDLVAIDHNSGSVGFGAPSGCGAEGTIEVHLTRGADQWASDEWDNQGIMLAARDEASTDGYRRFYSADGASPPTIEVLWSDPSYDEANAPTIGEPFLPEPGDRFTDSVTGSAVYADPNGDDGYVLYWTYLPDTYAFSVNAGSVVDSGNASEIVGTVPWDVPFAMRAVAIDDDTPFEGERSSPLTPFIDFEARSVQVTSPLPDQVLFGTETMAAVPQVTTNITGVQFRLDGTVVTTDTTAPYEVEGDSTMIPGGDGPHRLVAIATYSSGPSRSSPPVDFIVDNTLNTQQRLQVDLGTDRIDIDEFTEHGVKGLLNQSEIPARYQSATESSVDPTAGVLSYLANGWESIGSGTQESIDDFLAGSVVPGTSNPSCAGDTVVLTVFSEVFTNACTYDTSHFEIFYMIGGPAGLEDTTDTSPPNGVPDYIDRLGENLEDARTTYLSMGYTLATGVLPIPVLAVSTNGRGFANPVAPGPLGHFITVETGGRGETYTARHELFHIATYSYTSLYDLGAFVGDFDDFIDDRKTTVWWLEASANWATHQAELQSQNCDLELPEECDPDLDYADSLGALFAEPSRYFADFDSMVDLDLGADVALQRSNSRAYGSFIFAEWLEEEYGPEFMLDTWEGIGEGDTREASEVIEDLLDDNESTTIEDVLPQFWLANYLFVNDEEVTGLTGPYTYGDAHLDRESDEDTKSWQSIIDIGGSPTEGDEFSELARPARVSMPVVEGDGDPEEVEVQVEPGGAAFIDIEPEPAEQGNLVLTVQIGDSAHFDKYRFSLVAYKQSTDADASGLPAVCQQFGEPVLDTFESESEIDSFDYVLQIDDACRTATLVITNIDPNSGDEDGDAFVVASEFNGAAPISGIQIASVDTEEHQGSDHSRQPSVAPNGGSVVFASEATDLVAGDVGDGTEIYRRMLGDPYEEGSTRLVSLGDDDVGADDSGYAVASNDGELVAFASLDDDHDDTSEPSDGAQVYVADLGSASVSYQRVSLFSPETGQSAAASRPSISGDGRYIAYEAGGYTGLDRPGSPSGVSAVYLYDRQEDETVCMSCVAGVPAGSSFDPDVSRDSGIVVFSSTATTLAGTDTNGVADVFAYDISGGTVTRISQAPGGGQATVASTNPRTGYDGSGVFAYQQGDEIHVIRQGVGIFVVEDRQLIDLAGNGIGAITYTDGTQVFHEWPVTTGDTPVAVAVGIGDDPDGAVFGGSLSYEGGNVAFASDADNLVGGDINDATDVFTRGLAVYFES